MRRFQSYFNHYPACRVFHHGSLFGPGRGNANTHPASAYLHRHPHAAADRYTDICANRDSHPYPLANADTYRNRHR